MADALIAADHNQAPRSTQPAPHACQGSEKVGVTFIRKEVGDRRNDKGIFGNAKFAPARHAGLLSGWRRQFDTIVDDAYFVGIPAFRDELRGNRAGIPNQGMHRAMQIPLDLRQDRMVALIMRKRAAAHDPDQSSAAHSSKRAHEIRLRQKEMQDVRSQAANLAT